MIAPESEAELAAFLAARQAPVAVQGAGSKAEMLRPVAADEVLSTAKLSGISLYAPKELVIRAGAGTQLAEIETVLAQHGQHLIGEPAHLFGEKQTLGGMVATNLSGPRRIAWGAMRDHVLGVRAVDGTGARLAFGGPVLKNVTGLDLCKLLSGSFGTLAVLTEITLKVLPAPETVGTVLVPAATAAAAVAVMGAALGAPYSVSGAAWDPGRERVLLRIEDFSSSVEYRTEKLAAQLGGTILGPPESRISWRDIRDCRILPPGEALWRVSVAPSRGAEIYARAVGLGLRGFLDWGGGLAWFSGPADMARHRALCASVRDAGGVWWVMRGPESFRAAVEVLPPEPPALAELSRRIKNLFDPKGIFNPMKMRAA